MELPGSLRMREWDGICKMREPGHWVFGIVELWQALKRRQLSKPRSGEKFVREVQSKNKANGIFVGNCSRSLKQLVGVAVSAEINGFFLARLDLEEFRAFLTQHMTNLQTATETILEICLPKFEGKRLFQSIEYFDFNQVGDFRHLGPEVGGALKNFTPHFNTVAKLTNSRKEADS